MYHDQVMVTRRDGLGLVLPVAFAGLLLAGGIFGFFYAWICSTMWGLDAADPRVAIAAMQAMNASVRNAVFAPAFFGTPLVCALAAFAAFQAGHKGATRAFAAAALLAGFVEPGETIEAAVRREVLEESQVPVGRVSYLSSQPWAFPNSLMFGCHGEATGRDITVDPVELEDARWFSREEMVDVLGGTHPMIRPMRRGAIAEFLVRNWVADTLD